MRVSEITKHFPAEEKFSIVDQIRRSSRSVCANIAEAWRKRRYPKAFQSKLSDCETEAEETRVWLEFSLASGYIKQKDFDELDAGYDIVIAQLVTMIKQKEQWVIKT